MSILSLDHISRTFHNRKVLDDLCLTVEAGEKLALIGDNGSGKTTLFRIITGEDQTSEGQVRLAANPIVAYLNQSPAAPDPDETALDNPRLRAANEQLHKLEGEIAAAGAAGYEPEPALAASYQRAQNQFMALGGYDYRPRLAQILSGLGISGSLLDRPLRSLSGGERMRVELGRLLVGTPDLLLLDEPTNHLDVDALEWLEAYLQQFNGTVLYISHDRTFIDNTATRVAELLHGKITSYPGNYTAFETQKAAAQALAAQTVSRLSDKLAHEQEVKQTLFSHRNFAGYHEREKRVARLSHELAAAQQALRPDHGRMSFRLLPSQAAGDPNRIILRARELGKSFGERLLFSGLDFELKAGRKVVLAGPNGCGKSTLLRIFTGADHDFTGTVWLSDNLTWSLMTQFVDFADDALSVYQELNRRTDLDNNGTFSLLARFGFKGADVEKQIRVLSGGERSRLYLCCLLQERPDLLLLDEPTNHLDIHSREILESALADFDGAIIAVSHDRYFISKLGNQVLGFVAAQVLPFDSYENYRRVVRGADPALLVSTGEKAAPKKSTPPGELPAKAPPHAAKSKKNPYRLRQQAARLAQDLREAEEAAAQISTEIKALEASLNPDSPPEDYSRLAELLEMQEQEQDRYLEAAIALEDFTEQS